MQYWNKDVHSYTAETGAIKQAANEVPTASDSPLDKAKKLYDLVQKLDNTDYSGKTGFTFFSGSIPAGNVDALLDKKSGNSNQIALLYLALAHAAGLNARADRIASRNRRMFAADFLNSRPIGWRGDRTQRRRQTNLRGPR
jgi:transglutaminase-like putative cysteine protease